MLMRDALSRKSIPYPDSWQRITQGESIKRELEKACGPIVERLFGYHLVRLGNLSSEVDLATSPIKHIVNLTEIPSEITNIRGLSRDLPLQQNSVDVFFLAAELDFAPDPHQILREIDRAITANGHVVIAGFNPFSLAGVMKYMPIKRGNVLHKGRFFTFARIKDWLQLLGFEIVQHDHVMYSSLFTDKRFLPGSRLQTICKRYLPAFASMYVMVARKREIPMSIIKPKWQVKKPRWSTAGASVRARPENP